MNIPLPLKHVPDLLPEMMGIDHDPLGPAPAELIQGMGQEGGVEHWKQGLGALQGIGPQAGAEAGGQNHGFHEWYLPDD
jgi:hypothetical protein